MKRLPPRMLRLAACLLCCCLALSSAVSAAKPRFAMAYQTAAGGWQAAAQTKGALQEVSPAYFDLRADGSLKPSDRLDRETVAALHRQGLRVVPLLSNHWDRALGEAALENAPALAAELARAVEDYDLDGVHLDLENLTHEHRAAHTELVRLVRAALPGDKTVAVAVAANPKGLTTGWHASYDYAGLAASADYLMIMAYDEHYRGSSPGPVSSLSFAERSVEYALSLVPPEQLVLGIPYYGRIWSDGGGPLTGQGLGDAQIQALLQTHGGAVTYDEAARSAAARFTVDPGAGTDTVAGIALTPGGYTVWYADERAKKELLGLVERYGLKGAGGWRLGQESAAQWDYYSLWLNGLPFSDLQGHWAINDVVAVAAGGLLRGVSPHAFAPDRTLTRAEAAVLLARLLDLPPDMGPAFSDTGAHWARAEIAAAASRGLVDGVGGGRFAPDAPVTREQTAVLLRRAAEAMGAASGGGAALSAFSDGGSVSGYAREAVSWAVARGILQGDGGRLSPQSGATRAQTAALLRRFLQTMEQDAP